MLTPQEAALESKAERIARIITREYGLKVRIEGTSAYIDLINREIVLPDMNKEELAFLAAYLDGFLDHECAHGIFTDAELVEREKLEKGQPRHSAWNVIEDYWIEEGMGGLYIGCKQNLDALNAKIDESTQLLLDQCDPFNKLLWYCQRIWRKQATIADYVSDPQVGLLLLLLSDEIEAGFLVRSTKDAISLADQILDKIQDLSNPPPPQQKEEEQGNGGGEGEGEGSESQSGEDEADSDPGGSDAGGGEEDDSGEPSEGSQEEEQAQEQAQAIQEQINSGEVPESTSDVETFVNDQLDKVKPPNLKSDPEDYVVFTEAYDTEVTYSVAERANLSDSYNKLKSQVSAYIGNMSTMLSLSLMAVNEAYWVGGARKGRRWDKRKMCQWFLGGEDDRVWKQLEQGEDWDTAVTMLWDCSGSMGNSSRQYAGGVQSKASLARLAAIAFHESLQKAGIPHEILGHNSGGKVPPELRKRVAAAKAAGQDLKRFSRLDQTDKRMVFVPFGEADGRALCMINGGSANRDGECVRWAAKRLAARPEKRKILIVGSDGQPAGARYGYTEKKYLQVVVREVIHSGIEVLALGIMDEDVRLYYPNWAVMEQATDIPTVTMRELSQQLFNRGTKNGRFPEFCKRSSRSGGI